jgi:hypothetical protein
MHNEGMETTLLPLPEQLRQRISACEQELRALRRLLRVSQDMQDAANARRRREELARQEGGPQYD